jgi:microcystin-dependent protein
MPIAQNSALFSILGTNYGGDGTTTFMLPNLQCAVPLHVGGSQGPGLSKYDLGESGGTETVVLATNWFPTHTHIVQVQGTDAGDNRIPSPSRNLAKSQSFTTSATPQGELWFEGIAVSGGGNGHNNLMPTLVVNYCIALEGVWPSRP